MVEIYNRETKEYEEEIQYGSSFLSFLYRNVLGRILLKLVTNPIISKISGIYNDSRISKLKIKKFIHKNNINMDEFEPQNYKTFNEFFDRKIKDCKRPLSNSSKDFMSPADSKLLVYHISNDLKLNIKGSTYTLNELVNKEENLEEYQNGLCLVFRLAIDDYHHYCYPDSGTLIKKNFLKGKLHTVRSISCNYPIYKVNQREYSILKTNNFGEMIYIEVGALMVGKIVDLNKKKFKKGEEKGYFKLGGSTIVMLVKENVVDIDKDILENSKKDIEVKVKYREKIGRADSKNENRN